jgi:hypothetical protein
VNIALLGNVEDVAETHVESLLYSVVLKRVTGLRADLESRELGNIEQTERVEPICRDIMSCMERYLQGLSTQETSKSRRKNLPGRHRWYGICPV